VSGLDHVTGGNSGYLNEEVEDEVFAIASLGVREKRTDSVWQRPLAGGGGAGGGGGEAEEDLSEGGWAEALEGGEGEGGGGGTRNAKAPAGRFVYVCVCIYI
jgi:hypothetical protein